MTNPPRPSGPRRRPRASFSQLHMALLFGALLVVLASVATLSIASRRIHAEQAAFVGPATGTHSAPDFLNRSGVLPSTCLAVSPLPNSYDASPRTQISLLGPPAAAI